MYHMVKSIRGIDDEIFRKFKQRAVEEGRNVGELLNEAMLQFLDSEKSRELNDYPAWDWDSETLSEDYEVEMYRDTT